MKKAFCLLGLFGSAAAIIAAQPAQRGNGPAPITVQLNDAQGQSVGTATITAARAGGVRIAFDLKNLPAGEHGVHIHAAAKCEGPKFTTAGGHFNPDGKQHGSMNPQGPHAGDLGNITVKNDGTFRGTVTDSLVNLGSDNHSLFTNGGTAIVIHANADDMKTDPSGNSGDRIACGVITR